MAEFSNKKMPTSKRSSKESLIAEVQNPIQKNLANPSDFIPKSVIKPLVEKLVPKPAY